MRSNEECHVLGGKNALAKTKAKICDGLDEHDVKVASIAWYGGECSWQNIQLLAEQVKGSNADVIIAVGGGKALDTGKMVSDKTKLPLITVPTIAATCAAITPVSVIYNENGHSLKWFVLINVRREQ